MDPDYVAGLLRHTASLEISMAELQEAQEKEQAKRDEHLAKLHRKHASAVRALQEQHAEELTQLQKRTQEQVDELQRLLQEREEAHRSLRTSTEQTLTEMQKHMENLQKEATGYDSQIVSLRAELEASQASAWALQQDLSSERKLVEEQEQKITKLKSEAEISKQKCDEQLAAVRAEAAKERELQEKEHKVHMKTLITAHAAELDGVNEKCEARIRDQRTAYDEQLADLRATLKLKKDTSSTKEEVIRQLTSQASSLQSTCVELEKRIAEQQSELEQLRKQRQISHAAALANLEASHQVALDKLHIEYKQQLRCAQQELDDLRANMRKQAESHNLAVIELKGLLTQREALILDFRNQLRQLQNDKEVAEQSVESLAAAKTWMTDVIRSLQDELKIIRMKLGTMEEDANERLRNRSFNPTPVASPMRSGMGSKSWVQLDRINDDNPSPSNVQIPNEQSFGFRSRPERVGPGDVFLSRGLLPGSMASPSNSGMGSKVWTQSERSKNAGVQAVYEESVGSVDVANLLARQDANKETYILPHRSAGQHQQVTNYDDEPSRAPRTTGASSVHQYSQQASNRSELFLHSARKQIEDLEAELQSAHARLSRFDSVIDL